MIELQHGQKAFTLQRLLKLPLVNSSCNDVACVARYAVL